MQRAVNKKPIPRINDSFSQNNAIACGFVELGCRFTQVPVVAIATAPLLAVAGAIQLLFNGIVGIIAEIGMCHHARFGTKESYKVWKERAVVAGGLAMAGCRMIVGGVVLTVFAALTLGIANFLITKQYRDGTFDAEKLAVSEGINDAQDCMARRSHPNFKV
jgi:hypothetical protein